MRLSQDDSLQQTATVGSAAPREDGEEGLLRALEEFRAALDRGEVPDRAAILARHSDVAEELSACLDSLDFITNVAPQLGDAASIGDGERPALAAPVEGVLGDFRLLREIGRGGMGVVYEAQQISLGRRVALKVLPFAAMLDKQQLKRFANEARAAATLDHPNIVQVHFVGSDRGVHFYAMQLIEGQSLAEVIAEMRADESGERKAESGELQAASVAEPPDSKSQIPNPKSQIDTVRTFATQRDTNTPAYFRTVARLGIQAAEALDHAHAQGVIHRDIKPANLLIDQDGKLWVTDFGLARIEADAGMTMTGDILGTLRYMSPEQALGKRAVIDHRADVYSLGATLYELVTLQPVFAGDDRQELLRQIAFGEPCPPRKLRRSIPAELETIVLKAVEKEPEQRYQTAQELADDLRRFLEHKPILAKRTSPLGRSKKWLRRHRAVAWLGVTALLLTFVGLAVSNYLIAKERRIALNQRDEAERHRLRAERDFETARNALSSMVTRLNDDSLPYSPPMARYRQDVVDRVTSFLRGFVDEEATDHVTRQQTGIAYVHLAQLHLDCDEDALAYDCYEQALVVFGSLVSDDPGDHASRRQLAIAQEKFGTLLYVHGRVEEADRLFRSVSKNFSDARKLAPDNPVILGSYASFLMMCPEPKYRDARLALEIAAHALQIDAGAYPAWFAKGAAHYREGRWDLAVESLEMGLAVVKEKKGSAVYSNQNRFYLAMALWQRGDREEAQRLFQWTADNVARYENGFEDDIPLRAEAAALLRIEDDYPKPRASGDSNAKTHQP